MQDNHIPDEILLLRSFTRLLYNSYRIYNDFKDEEENVNYYENANHVFKEIIEDDLILIKNYNKCCFVLFGDDENFCGRFSIKYIKKAIKIIKKNYNEFIMHFNKEEQLLNFFDYIFEPVLKNMYDEYIQNLKSENEKILENFIFSCDETQNDCTICMESFAKNNCCVKFDCNHIFHYDCISNWFMEKQCCPICRKEF